MHVYKTNSTYNSSTYIALNIYYSWKIQTDTFTNPTNSTYSRFYFKAGSENCFSYVLVRAQQRILVLDDLPDWNLVIKNDFVVLSQLLVSL